MRVSELIAELQKHDPDKEVFLRYTDSEYGWFDEEIGDVRETVLPSPVVHETFGKTNRIFITRGTDVELERDLARDGEWNPGAIPMEDRLV